MSRIIGVPSISYVAYNRTDFIKLDSPAVVAIQLGNKNTFFLVPCIGHVISDITCVIEKFTDILGNCLLDNRSLNVRKNTTVALFLWHYSPISSSRASSFTCSTSLRQ